MGKENHKEAKKTPKKHWIKTLIPWIKHAAEQNGRSDSCRYFSVAVRPVERKDANSTVHSIMLRHWGREKDTEEDDTEGCGKKDSVQLHFSNHNNLVKW